MENSKKVTKKEYYVMLKEVVENAEVENKDELVEFINKQVKLLEDKAAKAKEKAAKQAKIAAKIAAKEKKTSGKWVWKFYMQEARRHHSWR